MEILSGYKAILKKHSYDYLKPMRNLSLQIRDFFLQKSGFVILWPQTGGAKCIKSYTLHVGLKSYDAERIADFADFDQIFHFL